MDIGYWLFLIERKLILYPDRNLLIPCSVFEIRYSLAFCDDIEDGSEGDKLTFKKDLVFALKFGGMVTLIYFKKIMTGTGVLYGIGETFLIIKTFEMKKSVGFEACSGHDLGDMFFAHPFHPGVAGVRGNFDGDIVDKC